MEISNESDFALENLPYGVFSDGKGGRRRVGVALGEYVVDLGALERRGYFTGPELDQRKCFTEVRRNFVQVESLGLVKTGGIECVYGMWKRSLGRGTEDIDAFVECEGGSCTR